MISGLSFVFTFVLFSFWPSPASFTVKRIMNKEVKVPFISSLRKVSLRYI